MDFFLSVQVGTGLGPTLEFYTLVSRELQRSDLMLFRGDSCPVPGMLQGASSTPQYIHSPVGVFPTPLGPNTRFSVVEDICNKFRFLGKLMAKAIMDSRMVSCNLLGRHLKLAGYLIEVCECEPNCFEVRKLMYLMHFSFF